MGTMSTDHLLMTATPLGLDDSAVALADIDPDSLLRTDDTDTMAVLVHSLYWTELHSPSSAPEPAGRIAQALAVIMEGWTVPFSGVAR